MRNASPALIALLNDSDQFAVADLLTIETADGTISRYTSASADVTAVSQWDNLSHVFSAGLPFTRGATKLMIGTEADSLFITLAPHPTNNLLNGIPWPEAAARGFLDEASIMVEKAIMETWGDTSPGTLILFSGRLSRPVSTRSSVQMEVKSALSRLRTPFPRNVYQPGCIHALFDTGCSLSQVAFTQSGAVNGVPTASLVPINVVHADGYFDLGTITFTSGNNDGLVRIIKAHATNICSLAVPLPFVPQVGDTFDIVPGCDKLQATCSAKFSNLAHFRGYPYIPVAEAAR